MAALFSLLLVLVLIAAITTFAVIMVRRSRKRRAAERARGTYRNPVVFTAFGWVVAIIGAIFLLFSGIGLLERDPMPGGMTIAGGVMLVVGVVWAYVYARRWITVWGERIDYQPFVAGERTIRAMDAVSVQEESDRGVTTLYIKGRDGRAASWYRSVFPPRTVAAFQHGVHHNAVESNQQRTALIGMVPFSVGDTLETPDGTTATWHRDRIVQVDVLISTPDEDLAGSVQNGLADTFTSLPTDTRTASFPGASNTSSGHGGTVDGARIEWSRRPGTTAIDARILAGGETGLDDARRAYGWLTTQLVEASKQPGGITRRSGQGRSAFTVTYRETWS